MEEYLETNAAALANDLVRHFHLSVPTAETLRGVLVQSRTHELGSALLAILGALFFGLGFGRVLQLAHVRAWQLTLPARETDQVLYATVLGVLYGLVLLLLVQLRELADAASWVAPALAPGWFAVLVAFFLWAPRLLTHKLIAVRDLLPGAILTAAALVALVAISRFAMEAWIDLYAQDYGGFGVVMALFFWMSLGSALIVAAAAVSPPLAERRRLRHREESRRR
jgi:membrane protein